MSYGYGVSLTPLDILTFYNTVANNGKFVHPHLGYSLQKGSFEKRINTDVVSHKICSEATIKKAHELLREVVLTGTAKSLKKLPFPVSVGLVLLLKIIRIKIINNIKPHLLVFLLIIQPIHVLF